MKVLRMKEILSISQTDRAVEQGVYAQFSFLCSKFISWLAGCHIFQENGSRFLSDFFVSWYVIIIHKTANHFSVERTYEIEIEKQVLAV